jgi:ATP/maltotriose-dependent transcriptional regulator MalT
VDKLPKRRKKVGLKTRSSRKGLRRVKPELKPVVTLIEQLLETLTPRQLEILLEILAPKQLEIPFHRRRAFQNEEIAPLPNRKRINTRLWKMGLRTVNLELEDGEDLMEYLSNILTPRELEVLDLRQRGFQNKEIAARLNIKKINSKSGTSETVKSLLKSMARKGIIPYRVKRYS